MTHDRMGSNSLPLTQDFMAHMLGTRRSSVTVAAGTLQKAGLISYTRGNVTILDRERLETRPATVMTIFGSRSKFGRASTTTVRPLSHISTCLRSYRRFGMSSIQSRP